MKAERFLKEYASAKIKWTEANELMQDRYKAFIIATCNGAVRSRERGIIGLEDAVRLILEAETIAEREFEQNV